LSHTLPLFLLQYLHKYEMVQTKYRRLPEYKEIQNPINTSQNQQKIKLAVNGDYNIKYRMRITEIFIQADSARQETSHVTYLLDFPHLCWPLPVPRTSRHSFSDAAVHF
jgi:hypothetical protein